VEIALYALGAVLMLAGLAGLVVPALPGSVLMVAAVVIIAWAGHFARLGWPTIAIAALLGALMWIVDHLAALLGAKAFGASRWALAGGAIGVVVGLFFGLPGIVLGPAVGAFALELWKGADLRRAARSGTGVLVGFAVGTVAKIALAFVLLGVVGLALVT
jgi:uncharacterized protein YqgC (DUF456 family)